MDVFKHALKYDELAWSIYLYLYMYNYRLLSMIYVCVCVLLENTIIIAYQYRLLSFYSTVEIHDMFVTRWDLSNTD